MIDLPVESLAITNPPTNNGEPNISDQVNNPPGFLEDVFLDTLS